MLFIRLLVVAGLLVQFIGERSSAAYKLEPISRVFAPTGSSATQSFEILNDGSDRIALTVSVLTLERDEAYVETNRDAEDEFLVYPAQIVLAPGKRQTLRVTWLGDAKPARELTYRIVVQQVPIELLDPKAKPSPELEGRVRVLLAYRGTLFIRPPKASPSIAVEARPASNNALALVLVNRGAAVGLVKSCAVTLKPASGPAIEIPAGALAAIRNHRVLAGGRRRYILAWPAGLSPQPVKAIGRCVVES